MKVSDTVLIALISTVPVCGTVLISAFGMWRGYQKDKREWERDRKDDREVRDTKLQEIHEQVNGNNQALIVALGEANEQLARSGQPVVHVVQPRKDAAA